MDRDILTFSGSCCETAACRKSAWKTEENIFKKGPGEKNNLLLSFITRQIKIHPVYATTVWPRKRKLHSLQVKHFLLEKGRVTFCWIYWKLIPQIHCSSKVHRPFKFLQDQGWLICPDDYFQVVCCNRKCSRSALELQTCLCSVCVQNKQFLQLLQVEFPFFLLRGIWVVSSSQCKGNWMHFWLNFDDF